MTSSVGSCRELANLPTQQTKPTFVLGTSSEPWGERAGTAAPAGAQHPTVGVH